MIKSFDYVNMVTVTYTDEKLSAVKMFSLDASGNAVDGDTIYSVNINDDKTTEVFYGRTYTSNAIKETYDPDNDTVVKSETYGSGTNSEFNISKSTDFFDREVSSQIQYKLETTLNSQLNEKITYHASSKTGALKSSNNHTATVTDSNGEKTYSYNKTCSSPTPNGDFAVYDYIAKGWDKTYRYDNAHQLIEEVNAKTGVGYKYSYDSNGNITSRIEYSGINSKVPFIYPNSTVEETRNYTYSSEWTDKLTSYNGQTISYDSLGNPLSYKGATLTWQGRNLMTYTTSERRVEYSYDADGLRMTKKVYDSQNRLNKTYIYTWSDSKLVGYKLSYTFYTPNANTPTSGKVTVKYLYNSDGETYGININSFDFYYVKDMQGNIVALISASNGKAVLLFDYTAYGIVTRTAAQDDETTLDSVADISDFDDIFNQMQDLVFKMTTLVNCWLDSTLVYKDYSYDSDTGMYYLQSRYYDPETGRFINADETEILHDTIGTINGANLFAYCNNDPVLNSDPSGNVSLNQIKKILSLVYDVFKRVMVYLIKKIGVWRYGKYLNIKASLVSNLIDSISILIASVKSAISSTLIKGLFKVIRAYIKAKPKKFLKFLKNYIFPFISKNMAKIINKFLIRILIKYKIKKCIEYQKDEIKKNLIKNCWLSRWYDAFSSVGNVVATILDMIDGRYDRIISIRVQR